MKLEQQVVSLELAQKLKELGVKQESFFKWGNFTTDNGIAWNLYVPPEFNKVPHPDMWIHGISAFTVAELGEMLPYRIGEYDLRFWSVQFAGEHHKYCGYLVDKEDGSHFMNSRTDGMGNNVAFMADTEADARAKMLVYLLENGLIK